jgi:hypothetical protein
LPCSAQGTTNAFLVVLHTSDFTGEIWRKWELELAVVTVVCRADAGDDADADMSVSVWRIVMSGRRWVLLVVDVVGVTGIAIAALQVTRTRRYTAKVVVVVIS